MIRTRMVLLLLSLCLLSLTAACVEQPATQVLPIIQPLPAREQARYRMLDRDGAEVGHAQLTITDEGAEKRVVGLTYEFTDGRRDQGTVTVDTAGMRPRRAGRTIEDTERTFVTEATYDAAEVKVTFTDGKRQRERKAALSESAYDNLSSLFLWRTLDLSVGTELRYVNVVVDPRNGSISRALGTVEVMGREEVKLPSGTVSAWRVQFRAAGVLNTAWYRADSTRTLVRYEIQRGPTLVLESVE